MTLQQNLETIYVALKHVLDTERKGSKKLLNNLILEYDPMKLSVLQSSIEALCVALKHVPDTECKGSKKLLNNLVLKYDPIEQHRSALCNS